MCDCIKLYSEALKESGKNTALDIPIIFDRERHDMTANRVMIATCKQDETRREKPATILANYCPFCGEKYPTDEPITVNVNQELLNERRVQNTTSTP